MPLTFEAVPRGMMFEAVPRGMVGKHYNQPGPGRKPEPMEETQECHLSVYSYALGKGIICRIF